MLQSSCGSTGVAIRAVYLLVGVLQALGQPQGPPWGACAWGMWGGFWGGCRGGFGAGAACCGPDQWGACGGGVGKDGELRYEPEGTEGLLQSQSSVSSGVL